MGETQKQTNTGFLPQGKEHTENVGHYSDCICIIGIDKGEFQVNGIRFSRSQKTSPNLGMMPIQIQEAHRATNRQDQEKKTLWHITVKTLSMHDKESILKATSAKSQVTIKKSLSE